MNEEISSEKVEIYYKKFSLDDLSAVFLSNNDNSSLELVPLSIIDLSTSSSATKWYCFAKNESNSRKLRKKSDLLVLEHYQNLRNKALLALQQQDTTSISYSLENYRTITEILEQLSRAISLSINTLKKAGEDYSKLIKLLESQKEMITSTGIKPNSEPVLSMNQDIDNLIQEKISIIPESFRTDDTERKLKKAKTISGKVKSTISSLFTSSNKTDSIEQFLESNKDEIYLVFAFESIKGTLRIASSFKSELDTVLLHKTKDNYCWNFTSEPGITLKPGDIGVILTVPLKKRFEKMIDIETAISVEQVNEIIFQEPEIEVIHDLAPIVTEKKLLEVENFFLVFLNISN